MCLLPYSISVASTSMILCPESVPDADDREDTADAEKRFALQKPKYQAMLHCENRMFLTL